MERLETRELAYFVAVGEELHFGRAARRLGMAQPPLSRAIRQLERRLGVTLLDRAHRGTSLTEAGQVLLHEARKALDAVAAAGRRAQRAGQSQPTLVVTMKPGGDSGLLPEVLAAYQDEPDAVPVEVRISGIGEQAAALRQGDADVAFLHGPHDDTRGFDTELLRTERQVLAVSPRHRLAGRAAVVLADLAGEPLPRWPGADDDTATGPEVRDSSQLMQLIALDRAVAVLPESVRERLRSDLVCVPVLDAEPSTVLLGWPERSRSRALAAFVRAATAVAARHTSAADDLSVHTGRSVAASGR